MRLLPEPAPALPPLASLVVHGAYPPSAPIHLCLSVPRPQRAVLITPSRSALICALSSDTALVSRSGTGAVASASSRVSIFYPNSPQHLLAVLGALRRHDVDLPSAPLAPNVTLDRAPSLLVLHEPSAYFLSEQHEYTMSSYLLLIIHALSTIEFLSQPLNSSSASLVVFDTKLDHLKLPVLRPPPTSALDEQGSSEDGPRSESVLFFAEKYFELSGTFEPYEQTGPEPQTPAFELHRIGREP